MKIGQEIKFKNDFKIETLLTNTKLQVKEGDNALVTKNGLKILTGEARGKITNFQESEQIKGYDHENISKMILQRLNNVFGLEEFAQDEDVDFSEMIDEIEDVLRDIF